MLNHCGWLKVFGRSVLELVIKALKDYVTGRSLAAEQNLNATLSI